MHRDIKLNNLLITCHRTIVLSDFGMAKLCSPGIEVNTPNVGTKIQRAPELATPFYSKDADIYGLGYVGIAALVVARNMPIKILEEPSKLYCNQFRADNPDIVKQIQPFDNFFHKCIQSSGCRVSINSAIEDIQNIAENLKKSYNPYNLDINLDGHIPLKHFINLLQLIMDPARADFVLTSNSPTSTSNSKKRKNDEIEVPTEIFPAAEEVFADDEEEVFADDEEVPTKNKKKREPAFWSNVKGREGVPRKSARLSNK